MYRPCSTTQTKAAAGPDVSSSSESDSDDDENRIPRWYEASTTAIITSINDMVDRIRQACNQNTETFYETYPATDAPHRLLMAAMGFIEGYARCANLCGPTDCIYTGLPPFLEKWLKQPNKETLMRYKTSKLIWIIGKGRWDHTFVKHCGKTKINAFIKLLRQNPLQINETLMSKYHVRKSPDGKVLSTMRLFWPEEVNKLIPLADTAGIAACNAALCWGTQPDADKHMRAFAACVPSIQGPWPNKTPSHQKRALAGDDLLFRMLTHLSNMPPHKRAKLAPVPEPNTDGSSDVTS